MEHKLEDIIAIFNQCFEGEYNTRLVKGGDEPIYIPANDEVPYHAIYFARGFYSSALHEIAHWLVAPLTFASAAVGMASVNRQHEELFDAYKLGRPKKPVICISRI